MHTNIDLQQQINDIAWLIKLRSMAFIDKLEVVINHCPCCTQRIIKNHSFYSDGQLKDRLSNLQEKLLKQINIDDAYEK